MHPVLLADVSLATYLPVLLIIVMAIGFTLQAGATGAVRAIKMSMKLIGGHPTPDDGAREPGASSRAAIQQ